MTEILSPADRRRILDALRDKYMQVAASPAGRFRYPTGREGLDALDYPTEILASLPAPVLDYFCGVGNPFSLGPLQSGEYVLDVGCGAGVDSLVAALMVGPSGRVAGVDLIPEMLARARDNLAQTPLAHVIFLAAAADHLPFPDAVFDVVISNGVLNLVVDKPQALREVRRVLKPGGRLQIADQILAGELPQDTASLVAAWAR